MPSKQIDVKVIAFLSSQDWPVTSEMVAKALKVSWNTATAPVQASSGGHGEGEKSGEAESVGPGEVARLRGLMAAPRFNHVDQHLIAKLELKA